MKYTKTHSDWIILGLIILISTLTVVVINILRTNEKEVRIPYSSGEFNHSSAENQKPLDTGFPAPAKEERNFYRTYTSGDIQYSIDVENLNTSRSTALTKPSLKIRWLNTKNTAVTPSGDLLKSLSLGCVAKADPYQIVPVSEDAFTLAPLESRVTRLTVDANCVYVGTSDGRYFWRLY